MNRSSPSYRRGLDSSPLGTIKLGNYRFSEANVLGYGFQSVVYKGWHATKKFQVAIKAVDTKNLKDGINKTHFENQIRCLETLKCTPHVLNLLEKVQIDDQVYLVTELCTGDLSDQIDKVLSEQEIWQFMKQLSKGFMYLWKQNIIHRDIKPKNLFINANRDIKYGDFGFAIRQGELHKQKKYNVGSPAYMAPEAFKYNQYSHASDIWAIGIIFYQMWTGNLPWNCTTQEQLQKRMNDRFINNFIEKGSFDERAKKLLRRTLKVDPKKRMTAQQLMEFFNEKKLDDVKKKNHNKSFEQKKTEEIEPSQPEVPLELASPLWQFKKRTKPAEKVSGFSINLKSTDQSSQKDQVKQELSQNSTFHLNPLPKRDRAQKKQKKFEKKTYLWNEEEAQEEQKPPEKNPVYKKPQPRTAMRNIKKTPLQLFSPDPRRKSAQKTKNQQANPSFIMKYLLGLTQNCYDLIVCIQSYTNKGPWVQHFPLLKACYKNLIVRTTTQIMNIQMSSKFLSQFCSIADIKDYMYSKDYEQIKKECQELTQTYKDNTQINEFWSKSKQNNFLGTLNATVSFLQAMKPQLKDNMKQQLQMALLGSLIARKLSLYLSSCLHTIKNDNDDSPTMKKNKKKICEKIDEAIQYKKNLFD